MIQEIYPHKLNNVYKPGEEADEESIVICFRGNDVLIQDELLPKVKDWPAIDSEGLVYLFSVDENKYFYMEYDEYCEAPAGYEFVNIRSLHRTNMSKKYRVFVIYTAIQLANWYRNNKFCGRCGARTELDENERAIRCSCGNIIYPRIVPAVIVGIKNGDRLLLTKYKTGFEHYALVAGFTEIGETLEETVEREAMEETGLAVKNIKYYKSQPWGIVDDLLMGFFCDVDGDDTITMDSDELKIAKWCTREEIELQPDNYSLTNEMMRKFKAGEI